MRIAYVCLSPQLSRAHTSGYAVHMSAVIDSLQRLGHQVEVLLLGEMEASGTALRNSPSLAGRGRIKRVIPGAFWEMARDLRTAVKIHRGLPNLVSRLDRFSPEVIYERLSYLALSGEDLARRYQIPRMIEMNAPVSLERARDGRAPLFVGWGRRAEMRTLRTAMKIRVVSSGLRDYLLEKHIRSDRIVVQPNGVDVDKFKQCPDRGAAIRRQYGLEGKLIFGFVGSFFQWQRIDTLLYALAQVSKACENAVLLVVGSGEGEEELRSLAASLGIASKVTFTGAVAHAEIVDYYSAIDVGCLAGTNWYNCPIKLLEYGAMGMPVIGPDTGSVRDFLSPDLAVLVPTGSVKHTAAAMRDLYDNPAKRRALGTRAQAHVTRNFKWSRVAASIANELEMLRSSPTHR